MRRAPISWRRRRSRPPGRWAPGCPNCSPRSRPAAAAGVIDRVTFTVGSAADADRRGHYDVACIFDALHDMSRPAEVLRACRGLLARGGSMVLMEPKAGEAFTAPADETERFLYAV